MPPIQSTPEPYSLLPTHEAALCRHLVKLGGQPGRSCLQMPNTCAGALSATQWAIHLPRQHAQINEKKTTWSSHTEQLGFPIRCRKDSMQIYPETCRQPGRVIQNSWSSQSDRSKDSMYTYPETCRQPDQIKQNSWISNQKQHMHTLNLCSRYACSVHAAGCHLYNQHLSPIPYCPPMRRQELQASSQTRGTIRA